MSRISVKLPKPYRYMLFAVFALSWISGLTFFVLSTWVTVEGDFGPEKHPLQYPVLQLHGAMAFFMLMFFGAVLAAHVPSSWRLQRLRILGLSLISLISVQIVTAYLLYYLSSEDIREVVSYIHLATGASLPVVLVVHIIEGIRSRRSAAIARSINTCSVSVAEDKAKAA